jgi:mRNA interferase HicA
LKGSEFLRKVRRLGRLRGIPVVFDAWHGAGSHGTLWLGEKATTLKDRKKEISRSLLKAMCDQLGISPKDL